MFHSVLPFCNLSLSTKHRGAYTWDATVSLMIMPSLLVKHDLIVGGGQAQGVEMLLTLLVGWRASVLRGKEAGRSRKVTGVSIVDVFAVNTLTVDSRVWLKWLRDKFSSGGGGLCAGWKYLSKTKNAGGGAYLQDTMVICLTQSMWKTI